VKFQCLSLDTFDALKIVKNGLEMRKLQPPPKIEKIKNSSQKKKPQNITKLIPKHPKNSFYIGSSAIRVHR
jgi:hypothetical protein